MNCLHRTIFYYFFIRLNDWPIIIRLKSRYYFQINKLFQRFFEENTLFLWIKCLWLNGTGVFWVWNGGLFIMNETQVGDEENTIGVSFVPINNSSWTISRYFIPMRGKLIFGLPCILLKLPLNKDWFANFLLKK